MLVINTSKAPTAIGTYSQAICHNDIMYLSGQIPIDPITMQLCSQDITQQIKQVFDNLLAICNAAGGGLNDIIKLTIYLIDLQQTSLLNEIMTHYFNMPFPARSMIGVTALPLGAQIEIDAIMMVRKSK